ncbi:hypothetical protein AB0H03_06490 [Streptomyces sparsogenes]|uniref:hypothetical protein n=1 Tax=Streptomyces sparsogenes TaxID=67365 RepID=UPI0033D92F48
MTDVHVESAELDDGVEVMFSDFGSRVRVAYDPRQTTEAAALVEVCLRVPRLIGGSFRLLHTTP